MELDFGVQVLTAGYWPTYKSPGVILPDKMKRSMGLFEEWHQQRHQKRKLKWVLTQGAASVRATFGKKSYDLQVSTLQAIILKCLSGGVVLAASEIMKRLNLEEGIIKMLCCRDYPAKNGARKA